MKFVLPLLLLDLFHTAPGPVDFLCSLQTVCPDTEVVGLFLFEVFDLRFGLCNQFLFFALPLFRGAVADLVAFCSCSLFPGSGHDALLLFEF